MSTTWKSLLSGYVAGLVTAGVFSIWQLGGVIVGVACLAYAGYQWYRNRSKAP